MALPAFLSALAPVASKVADVMRKKETRELLDDAVANVAASSLIEMGRVAQVEAITVVDNSLTVYDSTTDVLKFLNSLYAGWYLSAASVLTDTGRIKTVKYLERLNPSKSTSYTLANNILSNAFMGSASNESIALGHRTAEDFNPVLGLTLPTTSAAFEAISLEADAKKPKEEKKEGAAEPTNDQTYVGGARSATDLTTVANLSVGQMVTLNVSDGKASKDVHVSIRLLAVPTQRGLIKTILKWSQADNRLKTRLSAWRAGELSFWRDVVFMRDLFTDRQKLLMNDKTELVQTLLGRNRENMMHSVMTAQPSVGTISSILVISADTLREAEQQDLDGKLRDFRYRQRIMNATGIMVIAVVDPLAEFVTVYTHTQGLASEYSIKQLKAASKGGSSDLGEIIKLMNQNQMPSF